MSMLLMGAGNPTDGAVDPSFTTLQAVLLAQYKLEGNANDSSGNGKNLTVGASAVFGSTSGDGYYSPDGLGDNLDMLGQNSFTSLSADFAVGFSASLNAMDDLAICGQGLDSPSTTWNFILAGDANGNVGLFLHKSATPSAPIVWTSSTGSLPAIVAGVKTHYIASFDPTTKTVTWYVNGVSVGTQTYAVSTRQVAGTANMQIGGDNAGSFATSKLYNVLIFSRKITSLEATYLAANPAPF